MTKKLPKIYQANFSHKIENNEKVFYSKNGNGVINKQQQISNNKTEVSNNERETSNDSVTKTIDVLFNTTGYVFNIPVEIKTTSKTFDTKIAGKVRNNIITLDNDVIPISDIVSIKRKDR